MPQRRNQKGFLWKVAIFEKREHCRHRVEAIVFVIFVFYVVN